MSATERQAAKLREDGSKEMVKVTKLECDMGGCTIKAHGHGPAKTVREVLNTQGWKCNDKARVDFCPEHAK
jgi:hypothetical protein